MISIIPKFVMQIQYCIFSISTPNSGRLLYLIHLSQQIVTCSSSEEIFVTVPKCESKIYVVFISYNLTIGHIIDGLA